MPDSIPHDVVSLAEESRGELPADFFLYYDDLQGALARGTIPEALSARGPDGSAWYGKIGPAILSELEVLLCTDDTKYAEVRKRGEQLGQTTIGAIGASVALQFGLTVAMATGAVAFIAIAIAKIGAATFCRMRR
jgi:hypothetical protein